jgi:hypothetical protein
MVSNTADRVTVLRGYFRLNAMNFHTNFFALWSKENVFRGNAILCNSPEMYSGLIRTETVNILTTTCP